MKENKLITMVVIVTIVSILLVFGGITYAYFTAFNNQGSTAVATIDTGKMLITYNDGTDNILPVNDIQPSSKILVDKTFSLTGTNTTSGLIMPFKIYLEYQNTFTNEELLYFFKRIDTSEKVVVNIIDIYNSGIISQEDIDAGWVPQELLGYYANPIEDWSNNPYSQEIASGYFETNSDGVTATFSLKMRFEDTGDNQDYNKGATFNGKIVINSPEAKVYGQIANYLAKLDKNENNLKIDDTADSNLRYTGINPNNFVSFNNKLWRIVGNFNVYNAETNQYETLTKIVSNDSIGSYSWDENNIGSWNQASLMKFLNKEYINTINESSKMIAKVRWNLGEIYNGDPISPLSLYNAERGTNHVTNPKDGVERQDYWDGKIGLPYASDIIYNIFDVNGPGWIYGSFWTLTSYYENNDSGVYDGRAVNNAPSTIIGVIPSIYLKSDVKIESGTGTTDDPYILKYEGSVPETPSSNKISDYIASLDKSIEGLEIDDTKDKNLRYVGEYPDNNIVFNQERWRIIGTFNVYNTDTKQNEVLTKIIRYNPLGSYSWDTSDSSINNGNGINEWSQSKLMTELNTDYLDTSKTNGTTTWYDGRNNSKNANYEYYKNIKSEYIDKIATVRWNLGGIDLPKVEPRSNNNTKAISPSFLTYLEENSSKKTYEARLLDNNNYSALNIYNAERGTNHVINPTDGVERKDYWDGKVGLIYPSDLAYADTTWLDFQTWTISPNSNDQSGVISSAGTLSSYGTQSVYPVIYLKSNVTITGGIGTSLKPYLIDGDTYDS